MTDPTNIQPWRWPSPVQDLWQGTTGQWLPGRSSLLLVDITHPHDWMDPWFGALVYGDVGEPVWRRLNVAWRPLEQWPLESSG